jgi:hypothetical protein
LVAGVWSETSRLLGESNAWRSRQLRRTPQLWEHGGTQALRQGEHLDLGGLDVWLSKQCELGRMHEHCAPDQRSEQGGERSGRGERHKHDRIRRAQLGMRPGLKAVEVDLPWPEHDGVVGSNATKS